MAMRNLVLTILPLAHATGHLNFGFPEASLEPVQFEINVDKIFIEETKLKVSFYRPSVDLQDDVNWNWLEGPPQANQSLLAGYWADEYDWFGKQSEISNNHSHWVVSIDGVPGYEHPIPIRFSHEKSERADAIPLLLLHGWPNSYLEWHKVLEPLISPEDTDAPAFRFIAPDVPGFGFSPAPTHSGMGPKVMAHAFDAMMKALGYEKYGFASIDLGWQVGMALAEEVPDSLIGHFCDFFNAVPTEDDLNEWFTVHGAYTMIQSLASLLAAQALTDTPVGFGGWVRHLQYPISYGYEYSQEELITNTMMLWIQGTYGHLRSYREFLALLSFNRTDVPTGVTQWGSANMDTIFPNIANFHSLPRDWLERTVNLVYLSRHDHGGHFPANNLPLEWTQEVRIFFGGLRDGTL